MTATTVVIPSWNGADLLADCLAALWRQTLPPGEVIVIDNGSTDGTAAMLAEAFPEVRLVGLDRNRGFAAAVNAGIRASDTPLIALLNNDAVAEPGWLAALVEAADGERVGMVASKIVDAADPGRIEGIGLEVDPEGNPRQIGRGEPDGPGFVRCREVFGPIAAAALYRRQLLDEVGLFDEDFFAYLEDVDLAWRARRAGWRCLYAPGAVVAHRRGSTGRRIPRRVSYLAWRNHPWLLAKNADRRMLVRFALRQPLRDVADLARLLAARRPLDALVLVSARAAALARLPRMLRRRRNGARARRWRAA
ncbi:putative glycosyltransferase [Gaiella occulta]|uniref:Putative glycosyltransferase n=1 Tax=Gaiella occulta TaxID=1002870 RepID=A0A7M2Z1S3_9ACTN|nr:glycosyltransferase family 2 protein [Gaiella occulta]RDI76260.1 putative glycosyltransferase [Gaiella occulta]